MKKEYFYSTKYAKFGKHLQLQLTLGLMSQLNFGPAKLISKIIERIFDWHETWGYEISCFVLSCSCSASSETMIYL